MAGGVKKPINIFKLGSRDEPKQVFNWRLWFAVLSFGLLGIARGVDEGLISGSMCGTILFTYSLSCFLPFAPFNYHFLDADSV